MTIDAGLRLFTRADYHKMAEVGLIAPDERAELLNGKIRTMSPVGSLLVSVVSRLIQLLAPLIGEAYQLHVQSPISLSEDSEPEPDLVLCRARPDFYAEKLPTPSDIVLLIEVSGSTLRYDRDEKLPLYAEAGISEVWIVDLKKRRIEQHHSPRDGVYAQRSILTPRDIIRSTIGVDFDVVNILG